MLLGSRQEMHTGQAPSSVIGQRCDHESASAGEKVSWAIQSQLGQAGGSRAHPQQDLCMIVSVTYRQLDICLHAQVTLGWCLQVNAHLLAREHHQEAVHCHHDLLLV